MTQLKKIKLSNIRRFGEDVNIDIASGATIILAPNGTGKTSIFEAMELALTGKVRRLSHPPKSIIRDNQESAKIRLEFENENFCEVNFHKEREPLLTNNHRSLFANVATENIPYLLHLTHFLTQNNKDWFVQSKSEDAASQLDSLSIGKDATAVNSGMVSLKRAATSIIERVQTQFNIEEERLEKWRSLVAQRSETTSPRNQNLLPKDEIANQIVSIEDGLFPKGLIAELAILKSTIAQLIARFAQGDQMSKARISMLSSLTASVELYKSLLHEGAQKDLSIAEAKRLVEEGEKKLLQLREKLDELNKELATTNNDIQNRRNIAAQQTLLEQEREKKSQAEEAIEKIKEYLNELNESENQTKSQISAVDGDLNKIRGFENRIQSIQAERRDIGLILENLEFWRQDLNYAETHLQRIPELDAAFKQKSKALNDAESQLTGLESAKELASTTLSHLSIGTNKVQAAVVEIAANLPTDAKECPVCTSEFSSSELQRRISDSLNKLNVALEPAKVTLRKAEENYSEQERIVRELKIEVNSSQERLEAERRKHLAFLNQANTRKEMYFVNFSNPDEARKHFDQELSKIDQKEADARKELSEFTTTASQQLLGELNSTLAEIQRRIGQVNQQMVSSSSELERATNAYSQIEVKLKSVNIDENNSGLTTAEMNYSSQQIAIQTLQESLKNELATQTQSKNALANYEVEKAQNKQRVEEIITSWKLEKLDGEPSQAEIDKKIKEEESKAIRINAASEKLTVLQNETVKWETYEAYFSIEKEIKSMVGGSTEEEFAAQLQRAYDSSKAALDSARQRNQAIHTLSRNLDTELESINEKLESINPLWSNTLKRLVVDPRFASTSLTSRQRYRKNYADVNVPLHQESVKVSEVASEAQITDIQLSFMLSMAQTYHWSPWRALLLDDPTQHHDLVHASAVFDLLRDYICDYNFQIMLATHDTVQAKFFMRKLQNDGIPSSLYILNATGDGVSAHLSEQ